MTMTTTACKRFGSLCCYNEYLDPKSNTCTECVNGSFGWHCKQRCPPKFYGRLCLSRCNCPTFDCNDVTGCVTENSTRFLTISPDITHQTSKDAEWTKKTRDLRTRITSLPFPAGQKRQYEHVNHHADTWIAVSCSLIGSLATLFLIGCLLYFCSRQRLKVKSWNRIRRILFSGIEPERNLQLLQEGHLQPTTLTTTNQCQDEDTYTEIRFSQISDACSPTCTNTICNSEKDHLASKEPTNVSRNTNLYEKCTFETEYDHVNLKVKSNIPELLHQKLGAVQRKEQDYVLLSEKGRSQKECAIHDESSKSLSLPCNLKRIRENYKLQPHSYGLCYVESENQITNDKEQNYVKLISDLDNVVTKEDPRFKEEGRTYSLARLLSYNDLNSDVVGKSGNEDLSIITPEVKKDLERDNPGTLKNRPYSYVKKIKNEGQFRKIYRVDT